jgi:two-component system cell cycle response regulator CtrA
MRVLLIEDEPTTARAIELMLTTEGFNVYSTDLGEEGLDLGKLYDYDIILLDLNLPDMHGYDVLKKLRVAKVQTPVLILSGISEMDSKVRSFGFGADDYVTKPFHREELVARIHAVVRRSKGHSQSVIRTGKLAVNLDAKTVEVDSARVHLTGKEYAMLELLSLRKGTTLTKEMFLNHLYGGMDEPELKIIDVFICKLRKKLAHACEGENYIETAMSGAARPMCCATARLFRRAVLVRMVSMQADHAVGKLSCAEPGQAIAQSVCPTEVVRFQLGDLLAGPNDRFSHGSAILRNGIDPR